MNNSIYKIRGVFVEIYAGTDIKTAIKDCIKLAKYSNNEIVFNFNGKLIQVGENSKWFDLYDEYNNWIGL